MEDIFRCGLFEFGVPDEGHAIWVVRRVLVSVVRRHQQFRMQEIL